MDRDAFQDLALIRLRESKALLEDGCWDGAYYLCGYVVECALKACISKRTKRYEFPPPRSTIEKYYTHNLKLLMESAGLDVQLNQDMKKDSDLEINWNIVTVWNESCRYERRNENNARELYSAVYDPDHGVLKWLKQHC
jgi:hypothetical protein